MSTPCNISVKTERGIMTIYVHHDGYLSYMGKMLLENYSEPHKAESIVFLGDCSSLNPSLACPEGHTYSNKIPGYSVFFGRDRDDDDYDAYLDGETLGAPDDYYDLHYYFNGKNWMVRQGDEYVRLDAAMRGVK